MEQIIHADLQFIAIWTLVLFVGIVTLAALIKGRRDKVKAQRLARSYYAHPAGQALAQRPPLERTRHIDRVGYDWTK